MPRNEVEGVIAQSDGYDSNHQGAHLYLALSFFLVNNKVFYFLKGSCLSVCLSICAHVHYVCFAEHVECPWGVFLCRCSWHKQHI